jgi:hypothetical protein
MEANVISHVIHDGWEVRFRENNQETQVRVLEPYLEWIRRFLANNPTIEILSLVFWAKRFPVADSPGRVHDMGRFFEKNFTPEEIATLPDNWLEGIRREIAEVDKEQLA